MKNLEQLLQNKPLLQSLENLYVLDLRNHRNERIPEFREKSFENQIDWLREEYNLSENEFNLVYPIVASQDYLSLIGTTYDMGYY